MKTSTKQKKVSQIGTSLQITTDQIITEAMSWMDTPYRHQASCKGAGCDCLGLIRGVYRAFWGEAEKPPAYSPDWAEAKGEETLALAARRHLSPVSLDAMAPGHVLLFRWRAHLPAKHAAIMVDDARFIHAQNGAAVSLAYLTPWWRRRVAYIFAFPVSGQLSEPAFEKPKVG